MDLWDGNVDFVISSCNREIQTYYIFLMFGNSETPRITFDPTFPPPVPHVLNFDFFIFFFPFKFYAAIASAEVFCHCRLIIVPTATPRL